MNSRWIYISLANVAVFTANIWLFVDKPESTPETQPAKEKQPQSLLSEVPVPSFLTADLIKKESASISSIESFHFPLSDPFPPLKEDLQPQLNASYEKINQKDGELKKAKQRYAKQAQDMKLLEGENTKLSQQLFLLDLALENNEVILSTQKEKIQTLEKSQVALRKKSFPTDIELVKKSIDRAPNLIVTKSAKQDPITTSGLEKEVLTDDIKVVSDETNIDRVIENETEVNNEAVEVEVDHFSGSLEFGFLYEQDNQITKAIQGRLILDYDEVDRYHINSDLDFEFEREDGETSTDKYRWQLQFDYNLDPENILFARIDLSRSKFASYEQEDIFTVGYGHIFFNTEKHKFNAEIGPGYRFSVPNAGEDEVSIDEFIVRTRLNYKRVVNANLQVSLDTVLETGQGNSVYSLNFKAQNRIYQELYLIFDFSYKYTGNVPAETVNTEILSGLSLLYAF